jgi:hypothetical protein
MDSFDGFGIRFTAFKSAGLLAVMAATAFFNRGTSTVVTLRVSPRTVCKGETVTVVLAGPRSTLGELRVTNDPNSTPDKLPFQLDRSGAATLEVSPRDAGPVNFAAVLSTGEMSPSESIVVKDGVALPGSTVFVFGPKSGAEVGEQVYVRGRARPGTAVRVSGKHVDGTVFRADPDGEWGGILSLKPGAERLTVVDVEASSKIEIPITVQ